MLTSRPAATRAHVPPRLPAGARQPTLAGAFGLILGYFALQLAFGLAAMTLARLLVTHAGANADDARLYALLATLTLAPLAIVQAARLAWPAMWPLGQPPGLGWCAPRGAGEYALAALLAIALPLVMNGLTMLLAHGQPVNQDVHQWLAHASPPPQLLMMTLAVTLVPLAEELVFRGVLLSALMRHLRTGWAIAASAGVFALVHLPDFTFQWYPLPGLALLGAVAAWLRLRGGSIRPAMLLHAGNNLFAVLVWIAELHAHRAG